MSKRKTSVATGQAEIAPVRLSPQQQQGEIGQDQVKIRLRRFGWDPKTISPDSGEDLLVEVRDEFRSSSLKFHFQIKSPFSLKKIKSNCYSYPFETKDLQHWRDTMPPVFVLLWDAEREHGFWIAAADVIQDLDARKPGWERKETAAVRVPASNATDDPGLRKLRRRAADIVFPAVAHNKTLQLEMSFQFPDTPEGQDEQDALLFHRKTGEEVELSGEHLSKFKFSTWIERLYGTEIYRDVSQLKFRFGPRHSHEIESFRLCALSSDRRIISQQIIEARAVAVGDDQITFANTDAPLPFSCRLTIQRSGHWNITVSLRGAVSSATKLECCIPFFDAFADGGLMRFEVLTNSERWGRWRRFEAEVEPQPGMRIDGHYRNLVEQLAEIERLTGVAFRLDDQGITNEEVAHIASILEILKSGRREQEFSGQTLTLKGFRLAREGEAVPSKELELNDDGNPVQLRHMVEELVECHKRGESPKISTDGDISTTILGVQVPLGPQQMEMTAPLLPACVARLERMLLENKPLDPLVIEVSSGSSIEIYTDWLTQLPELK